MTTEIAELLQRVHLLAEEAAAALQQATSLQDLESLRVKYLGRKSELTQLSRGMKSVVPQRRREVGQAVNAARDRVESSLRRRQEELQSKTSASALDISLPGFRARVGRRHPLMATMEQIKSLLVGMGFRYDDYPECETEYHNFDGLNTPWWHPARDAHDTFYTQSGRVMRTHTTAFQLHALQALAPPPIRAMTSGRCYRCDTIDASHFPIFHQLDAIAIDRDISFADLKWTLYELARALFGADVRLRFRPSFFPFTTPSAEVDVFFQNRWLEILGSGMIHPHVLRAGGLDPDLWQGFAFGLGVDRMTMIRHNIDDIRLLYENEEMFLRQF